MEQPSKKQRLNSNQPIDIINTVVDNEITINGVKITPPAETNIPLRFLPGGIATGTFKTCFMTHRA